MKENIKVALIIALSIVSIFEFVIIITDDDYIGELQYKLDIAKAQLKISSSLYDGLSDENKMLRQANECLITYSYRDRCITAIKHTPLPKLEMI